MRGTEPSLVQDIVAHPNDDAARLVYADWLEERGSLRGEFIRAQCELESLEDPHDPRRTELEGRQLQLVRQHSKEWAKPLRGLVRKWWFRRGLIYGVEIDTASFLSVGEELWQHAPIQHVQLRFPAPHLKELAKSPLLSRLTSLSFRHGHLGRGGQAQRRIAWSSIQADSWQEQSQLYQQAREANTASVGQSRADFSAALRKVLDSRHVKNLESLDLTDNGLGDAGLAELLKSKTVQQLKRLYLGNNELTPEAIALLKELKSLRELFLDSCTNIRPNYDEDVVGPLPEALAPLVPQLESLDLVRCCLSPNSLAALVEPAPAGNLRRLSLAGNMLMKLDWMEGAQSFSKIHTSSLFDSLHEFDASSCYLSKADVAALVRSEHFQSVRTLRLNNDNLMEDDGGLDAIVNAKHAVNLAQLEINGANPGWTRNRDCLNFSTTQFRTLMESNCLPQMAWLSARQRGLKSSVVKHLLHYADYFYYVDLSNNKIDSQGAKALVLHGPWDKLAVLNLRANKLGKSAKDALKKVFGARVVV